MKKFSILLIEAYQNIFSSFLKNILGVSQFCRFTPTCSEYAKTVINEKGIIKGGYLSLVRILKCQPLYKTIKA